MKHTPAHLLYHAVHKRTMRSYLGVFIVLAAIAVGGGIALVKVELPPQQVSRGEGSVIYRRDAFTRFRVRQHSAMPLRLPDSIEPAAQLPLPSHPLPIYPAPRLLPPPPLEPTSSLQGFMMPDDAYLLELPPPQEKEGETP